MSERDEAVEAIAAKLGVAIYSVLRASRSADPLGGIRGRSNRTYEALCRAVEAGVKLEREACAALTECSAGSDGYVWARDIAVSIRARGDK